MMHGFSLLLIALLAGWGWMFMTAIRLMRERNQIARQLADCRAGLHALMGKLADLHDKNERLAAELDQLIIAVGGRIESGSTEPM